MLISESIVMVVLVAIATYVACFKLTDGPTQPYVASLAERLDEPEATNRLAARSLRR